jgi:hypothetical protein
MTPIIVSLPLRLESVANLREHWSKRAKRAKEHRAVVGMAVRIRANQPWPERVDVLLVRIAPRPLDDDNLRGAFKACRDSVADVLGVDDADPRVTWRYDQEKPPKGAPKAERYGLRIELRASGVTHEQHSAIGGPLRNVDGSGRPGVAGCDNGVCGCGETRHGEGVRR